MVIEVAEWTAALGQGIEYSVQAVSAVFMPGRRRRKGRDGRPWERLRAHYVVERNIADRLRAARGFEERRGIAASMYAELFRKVPDHPRIAAKGASTQRRERDIRWNMAQLKPYLRKGDTFLEVGAGDCALASRVADEAASVYALDISTQAQAMQPPANVHFVLTDGRSIDVPPASVDLAFSDQLMEHLHPDDALDQLRNIHASLKPGGVYMCVTPNRLYGPSDISGYFDDVATGFHLHEYTVRELRGILRKAGFPRSHVYIGARGHFMRCPAVLVEAMEVALGCLPRFLRRPLAHNPVARALLGVRVAGIKG
jgi:SAM-dependent methyltransferase